MPILHNQQVAKQKRYSQVGHSGCHDGHNGCPLKKRDQIIYEYKSYYRNHIQIKYQTIYETTKNAAIFTKSKLPPYLLTYANLHTNQKALHNLVIVTFTMAILLPKSQFFNTRQWSRVSSFPKLNI